MKPNSKDLLAGHENKEIFYDTLADQLRSAIKSGKIGCAACQKKLATHKNYRCYYCNIFYCPSCAKKHFERDEHINKSLKNRLVKIKNKTQNSKIGTWIAVKLGRALCSGFGVYSNGLECPGCEDCL